MSAFKVGQRVRIKCGLSSCYPGYEKYQGCETTIRAQGECYDWLLDIRDWAGEFIGANSRALEPLTPPAASSWVTDAVRKVTKPQHTEPVAPKVKVIS